MSVHSSHECCDWFKVTSLLPPQRTSALVLLQSYRNGLALGMDQRLTNIAPPPIPKTHLAVTGPGSMISTWRACRPHSQWRKWVWMAGEVAVKGRVLAPTARTMKSPQRGRFVIALWEKSRSRLGCGRKHSGKRAQEGLFERGSRRMIQ